MDYEEIWKRGFHLAQLFNDYRLDSPRIPPWRDHPNLLEKDVPFVGYYTIKKWNFSSTEEHEQFNEYTHFGRKITSGEWVAVGYESPRRPSSKLRIMPTEIMEAPNFDIDNSIITGDGYAYAGLRIVRRSLIDAFQAGPEKPTGRPSQRERITRAYERMRDRGEIDFGVPKKIIYEPIRNIVAAEMGLPIDRLRGVGDEAIRRTIGLMFDEDRDNKL